MSFILKIFSIETLITTVVAYLTSTVKNPGSTKVRQLRAIVHQLYKAAKFFLESTGGIPEEF